MFINQKLLYEHTCVRWACRFLGAGGRAVGGVRGGGGKAQSMHRLRGRVSHAYCDKRPAAVLLAHPHHSEELLHSESIGQGWCRAW